MGKVFLECFLGSNIYACSDCKAHVAQLSAMIWEGFMGRAKPAYLFRSAVNTEPSGPSKSMALTSGDYTLVDICCKSCNTVLGWKYLTASLSEQKYKEGTFLLEKSKLVLLPNDH